MRRLLLAPIVLSIFSALAADPGSCRNPIVQSDMNACARQSWKTADQILNKEYQALLQRSDDTRRKLLRNAQRAWLPFRDAYCAVEEDADRGGSIAPLTYWNCMEQMTDARIKQLRALAE